MATAKAVPSAGSAAACRTSSSRAVGITASVHVDAGRVRDPRKGLRISSKRRSRNVKKELQADTTRRRAVRVLPAAHGPHVPDEVVGQARREVRCGEVMELEPGPEVIQCPPVGLGCVRAPGIAEEALPAPPASLPAALRSRVASRPSAHRRQRPVRSCRPG